MWVPSCQLDDIKVYATLLQLIYFEDKNGKGIFESDVFLAENPDGI